MNVDKVLAKDICDVAYNQAVHKSVEGAILEWLADVESLATDWAEVAHRES